MQVTRTKPKRKGVPHLRGNESVTEVQLETCIQTLATLLEKCRWLGPHLPAKRPLHLQAAFLTAAQMSEVNGRFRGKRVPTDVLSFRAEPAFFDHGHLGEILICRSVLNRQAKSLGHTRSEELWVLLVHGVLHLLGYDHEIGEQEARRMAQAEVRLLRTLPGSFDGKTELSLIGRVKKKGNFARQRHGHSKRNSSKK